MSRQRVSLKNTNCEAFTVPTLVGFFSLDKSPTKVGALNPARQGGEISPNGNCNPDRVAVTVAGSVPRVAETATLGFAHSTASRLPSLGPHHGCGNGCDRTLAISSFRPISDPACRKL